MRLRAVGCLTSLRWSGTDTALQRRVTIPKLAQLTVAKQAPRAPPGFRNGTDGHQTAYSITWSARQSSDCGIVSPSDEYHHPSLGGGADPDGGSAADARPIICLSSRPRSHLALSHGDSLGASRAIRWNDSTVTRNDSPAVGGGIENGQRPRDEILP